MPENPVVTVIEADGTVTEVDLGPTDLYASVLAGADAGLWSEADGVVVAIEGVLGLRDPVPGLSPDSVPEVGLTPLLLHAADLLDGGDLSDDERGRLEAILGFVTPTQEALDALSEPSGRQGSGWVQRLGVADRASFAVAAALGPDDACAAVGELGFSSEFEAGEACFVYEEFDAGNSRVTVYYPRTWSDDPSSLSLVDRTIAAVVHSLEVYSALNLKGGDVNVVFSVAENSDSRVLANVARFDQAGSCPTTVFPSGATHPAFEQLIAHEIFHCVQTWDFGWGRYGSNKWWVEGSAHFFSNLAYPTINEEQGWAQEFSIRSAYLPLTGMSYENTTFFQYLSNRIGNAALIEALRSTASAGGSLAPLAAVSGMDEIWRDFIVAMTADSILDTGGGTLPTGRFALFAEALSADEPGELTLTAEPFVATRYRVSYPVQSRVVQEEPTDSLHATVRLEDRTDRNAWSTLPAEIRTTCDLETEYVVVVSTVDQPQDYSLAVTEVEEAECDPCIVGGWDMDLATFAAGMERYIDSLGGLPQGGTLDMGGSYILEFDSDGGFVERRDPLIVTMTLPGQGSLPVSIEGTDSGTYTTDGETLTVTGLTGSAEASIGGLSSGLFASEGPGGGSGSYECMGDILSIDVAEIGEIVFARIEELPKGDPIPVELGRIDAVAVAA